MEWKDESYIEQRCVEKGTETYYIDVCVAVNKFGQCTKTMPAPQEKSVCVRTERFNATRKACVQRECDVGYVPTESGDCVEGSPVAKAEPKEKSGNGSDSNSNQ